MAAKPRRHLATVDEVLDVVGVWRARKIARVSAKDAHYMWVNRKAFPPRTYAAFIAALKRTRCTADPKLWRQWSLPRDC